MSFFFLYFVLHIRNDIIWRTFTYVGGVVVMIGTMILGKVMYHNLVKVFSLFNA